MDSTRGSNYSRMETRPGAHTSSVLPVNADLQQAVLVEGGAHLQRPSGAFPQGGGNRQHLLLP